MSHITTINPDESFYGRGSPGDISVSYEDYHEIVSVLHDDRLSRKTIMDFKNLKEVNFFGTINCFIYGFPPALATTWLVCGPAKKSHSGYRYQWPMFLIIYPFYLWGLFTLPIRRKLYTKILANDTEDGTYIRNTLKMKTPGLWQKLSAELWNKGYRFPEQLEVVENQIHFPTNIVPKINH
mmetsp:Transcript_23609/g.20529  ORF Transcript_23609/g.20529 Transcript_23609/m.20529 type:complete len:181 (+) Transcript_23609:34-576(+)